MTAPDRATLDRPESGAFDASHQIAQGEKVQMPRRIEMEPRVPEFSMASALGVRRRDGHLSAFLEPTVSRRKGLDGIDHMFDHEDHHDDLECFLRNIRLLQPPLEQI